MRQLHGRLEASVEYYEARIAEQDEQLSRLNRSRGYDDLGPDGPEFEPVAPVMTEEDLRQEEEEVRQLERKKKGLEERVNSMGRDISGVLR
jgi:predicted  nucleic acid-binding Zn-ribbon protein